MQIQIETLRKVIPRLRFSGRLRIEKMSQNVLWITVLGHVPKSDGGPGYKRRRCIFSIREAIWKLGLDHNIQPSLGACNVLQQKENRKRLKISKSFPSISTWPQNSLFHWNPRILYVLPNVLPCKAGV